MRIKLLYNDMEIFRVIRTFKYYYRMLLFSGLQMIRYEFTIHFIILP
jgi:hypothetical protein